MRAYVRADRVENEGSSAERDERNRRG